MTERTRATFLSTFDLQRLDLAVYPIVRAFDEHPYLVGSVNERADYRDVDVRLMISDETFDALFSERRQLWCLVCYAINAWLRAETGLPIDFQIQRQTEANEKYGGQFRNALGVRAGNYAGYGDATKFEPLRAPVQEAERAGAGTPDEEERPLAERWNDDVVMFAPAQNASPDVPQTRCENCDGDGRYWHWNAFVHCSACNGTGAPSTSSGEPECVICARWFKNPCEKHKDTPAECKCSLHLVGSSGEQKG
jgi:hypothetical protein